MNYDFTPTPEGQGYFNFHKTLGIWVEVLSFDKLIDDAKRRNAVFFEKLGVRQLDWRPRPCCFSSVTFANAFRLNSPTTRRSLGLKLLVSFQSPLSSL